MWRKSSENVFSTKPVKLLAVLMVIICAVIAWASSSKTVTDGGSTTPIHRVDIRAVPLSLKKYHRLNASELINRSHLVIERLYPASIPRWGELLHALRLWGTTDLAPANASGDWSTSQMRRAITDAQFSTDTFGSPIQIGTRHGVTFAKWNQKTRGQGEPHRDNTVAVLGFIGFPAVTPIVIRDRHYDLGDAICASAANFSWDDDAAFSAIAFSFYLEKYAWINKYDQRISLSDIADRLCDVELGAGPCFGTHTLYAMAVLLSADSQSNFLGNDIRRRLVRSLFDAKSRLESAQASDGAWDADWFSEQPTASSTQKEVIARITSTSHHLEWLAIAPAELHLADERCRKALEFLIAEALSKSDAHIQQYYTVYSHIGTTLIAWLGDQLMPASLIEGRFN
jgi:hypothetical protein